MSEVTEVEGVRYVTLPDPRYRVGDDGSVWSRCGWRGRMGTEWKRLKSSTWRHPVYGDKYPYQVVGIGGKVQKVSVLVLTAFHGPPPDGYECAHLNGKHDDDRLSNLAWKTHADNCADRRGHGTTFPGTKCKLAKLTESDIRPIRQRLAAGETQEKIAADYGVNRATIAFIGLGRTWKHVV